MVAAQINTRAAGLLLKAARRLFYRSRRIDNDEGTIVPGRRAPDVLLSLARLA